MSFTAAQIAEQLQGEVLGDSSVRLTGFAPADCARVGDLTFAEKEAYFAAAEQSLATAVLVSSARALSKKVLIRVPNARIAVARVLPLFFPPEKHPQGIHPSAVIDASAQIGPMAYVGPHCVVGAGVRLGARSVLMGGNQIGRDCQISDDVCLHPNVVIYANSQIGQRVTIHAGTVIGSDGYGYVLDEGRHRKMLQVGNVIIHDDVEIGALVAIYALQNRIRLNASEEVIQAAAHTIDKIGDSYKRPSMTAEQIRSAAFCDIEDPLKEFGEACRNELNGLYRAAA